MVPVRLRQPPHRSHQAVRPAPTACGPALTVAVPAATQDVTRRFLTEADDARRLGRIGAARAAYRAALALAPDDLSAAMALGTLEGERGLPVDGLRHLSRVVRHLPDDADAQANVGSALLAGGERATAIIAFCRALSLWPDHVGAHYNLGLAHHRVGSHASASTAYRRAVAIHTRHIDARRNLAVSLHASGATADAARHLHRLVLARPERLDLRENLALILLDAGDTQEAFRIFDDSAGARYAPSGAPFAVGSDDGNVTPTKLKHDSEQLAYVISRGLASPELTRLRDLYADILARVPTGAAPAQPLVLSAEQHHAIGPWYARRYLRRDAPIASGRALHPALDLGAMERRYLADRPELVVVDDLLSGPTQAALQRFCMENSFWVRSYGGGYLGSFMEDGFVCPLLAQVADEIRASMPAVLGPHTLKKVWGFKYDSRLSGINLHADFAAVNVNFWIMPDAVNQDPASGGLIVWNKPAPLSWGFEEYNRSPEQARRFLDDEKAKAIVVPYRGNRAVIFNSNLFHETDRIAFRDGYENRRINITFLYGSRS